MPKTSSSPERVGLKALAAAERVLRTAFQTQKPSSFGYKANHEILTKADLAANRAILSILKRETPDFDILSEEGSPRKASTHRWIVDPLDGTTNFAAHLPLWGVSIALEVDGQVVLGLISLPVLGERYIARLGGGAWRFDGAKKPERLHVSKTKILNNSLGLLCYGYRRIEKQLAIDIEPRLALASRSVRRLGSAVIEAAWVATGRADFSLIIGARPWDIASGTLLVREAGGSVVTPKGTNWTIADADVLFSAPAITKEALKRIDLA